MLNQLVESRNNGKEMAKRAKFVGTTFVLVVSLAFSGVLWSLFAKDIGMNKDQLELSTLIAPVAMPETKPQPPEPVAQKPRNTPQNAVNETTRQANILRLEESPKIPTEISVVQNSQKARPNAPFKISNAPETNFQSTATFDRNSNNVTGNGIEKTAQTQTNNAEIIKTIPPPPPLKDKTVESAAKKNVTVSGGVMNGKALNLPKPFYSAAAKAINASGDVSVQITVDENGKVVSASAINGHPLLKNEAEKAARNARFSPTLLSKQPVKVSGLIVYRFTK